MKKYNIIYADPPWRYERSGVQGAAEKHYPTMAVDELDLDVTGMGCNSGKRVDINCRCDCGALDEEIS